MTTTTHAVDKALETLPATVFISRRITARNRIRDVFITILDHILPNPLLRMMVHNLRYQSKALMPSHC